VPVWCGRRAVVVAECQLHDALLNLAVEPDTPLLLLCPHDVGALAPEVVAPDVADERAGPGDKLLLPRQRKPCACRRQACSGSRRERQTCSSRDAPAHPGRPMSD
jgi:hypothetical protein